MSRTVFYSLLFLLFSGVTCQPSAESIDSFWPAFQRAVAKGDAERVANLTHFPLPGAEPFVRSQVYVAAGVLREPFIASFERLFDERARQVIARTRVENLEEYTVQADSYAELLGIPVGTEVFRLAVRYVREEGTENQTESTVFFNFITVNGAYGLGFIELAG